MGFIDVLKILNGQILLSSCLNRVIGYATLIYLARLACRKGRILDLWLQDTTKILYFNMVGATKTFEQFPCVAHGFAKRIAGYVVLTCPCSVVQRISKQLIPKSWGSRPRQSQSIRRWD